MIMRRITVVVTTTIFIVAHYLPGIDLNLLHLLGHLLPYGNFMMKISLSSSSLRSSSPSSPFYRIRN